MTLSDLTFSDLFIAPSLADSWFTPSPDAQLQLLPDGCQLDYDALYQQLITHKGEANSFNVKFQGMQLRVERIEVYDAKQIYICRRFKLQHMQLSELGLPESLVGKMIQSPLLKRGLVVVMGETGSGKTTTGASLILERLRTHGGVCWTVENPIELPMQGVHGKGLCYQTQVDTDEEMGQRLTQFYRANPTIIFIGEAKRPTVVREAINAANSGHLVVVTFHAGDLLGGLERFYEMAGEETKGLASALRLALHLQLKNKEDLSNSSGIGSPARILSFEQLWVEGESADSIKSTLRSGSFHMLKSDIERQKRNSMGGRS